MKCILIKNRHRHRDINDLPALFAEVSPQQVFDFDLHKKILHRVLENQTEITLYVTGLTPLLISVINYCRLFNISIVLMHYDTNTHHYVPQSVV